ncbi:transposase [Streptomyces canus]|uniref:transposase n=1 Tax=Streptomyces canus TaxID=58343 RepID=UPI0038653CB0
MTVVLLPGYAPDLNPVEALWAHIKRSLANLAARALGELETQLRRRLKALQYRQDPSAGQGSLSCTPGAAPHRRCPGRCACAPCGRTASPWRRESSRTFPCQLRECCGSLLSVLASLTSW